MSVEKNTSYWLTTNVWCFYRELPKSYLVDVKLYPLCYSITCFCVLRELWLPSVIFNSFAYHNRQFCNQWVMFWLVCVSNVAVLFFHSYVGTVFLILHFLLHWKDLFYTEGNYWSGFFTSCKYSRSSAGLKITAVLPKSTPQACLWPI